MEMSARHHHHPPQRRDRARTERTVTERQSQNKPRKRTGKWCAEAETYHTRATTGHGSSAVSATPPCQGTVSPRPSIVFNRIGRGTIAAHRVEEALRRDHDRSRRIRRTEARSVGLTPPRGRATRSRVPWTACLETGRTGRIVTNRVAPDLSLGRDPSCGQHNMEALNAAPIALRRERATRSHVTLTVCILGQPTGIAALLSAALWAHNR